MFETVARSRWPWSMRVKRSRFVFSQSCSVFWRIVSRRLRIISLSRSLSTATSPLASTLTWRVRSPSVTAVATSAIARTWLVRFAASWLTSSVRSFQTPATSCGLRLAAELALDADLARDARDLAGEPVELVDHRVDGVLQLEELAAHVGGDLLAQVAVGDRGRDLGDVADLAGEVARHQVDVVGQLLPHAADLDRHGRGLPELALGADLARDARDLGDEAVELVDHAVDRVLELEHLALDVGGDLLAQVAVGDRADDALHLVAGADEILDQAVDRLDAAAPDLVGPLERDALGELALLADDAADALELGAERLVRADDLVQPVRDLAPHARPVHRHARREVTGLHLAEDAQQHFRVEGLVQERGRVASAWILESGGLSRGLDLYGDAQEEGRGAARRPLHVPDAVSEGHRPPAAGALTGNATPVLIRMGTTTYQRGPNPSGRDLSPQPRVRSTSASAASAGARAWRECRSACRPGRSTLVGPACDGGCREE